MNYFDLNDCQDYIIMVVNRRSALEDIAFLATKRITVTKSLLKADGNCYLIKLDSTPGNSASNVIDTIKLLNCSSFIYLSPKITWFGRNQLRVNPLARRQAITWDSTGSRQLASCHLVEFGKQKPKYYNWIFDIESGLYYIIN